MNDMSLAYTPFRFTLAHYHRMGEAAIFDDARVELIDGEIIYVPPMSPPHASCVSRLASMLSSKLGANVVVRPQMPVELGDQSEPEPDLVVASGAWSDYASRHPSAREVLLAIEVSGTSLLYDLNRKLSLYAAHDIAEVWIVDLNAHCIRVFSGPQKSGYAEHAVVLLTDQLAPVAFPGVKLDVAHLIV